MRIKATSDLHGYLPDIEDCDLLLIAGDICPDFLPYGKGFMSYQAEWVRDTLAPWVNNLELNGIKVAAVAGNHDFIFEHNKFMDIMPWDLLEDEEADIEGVKIYGTPYVPTFGGWAFMEKEPELAERYSKIPEGLDILLCHGPPYGMCDIVNHGNNPVGKNLGSKALREEVIKKKPKTVVFGHIHSGLHMEVLSGNSICRNVSYVNELYKPTYEPWEFEL